MCDTEYYLSDCCGSTFDRKFKYESGVGVCSKCGKKAEFWDEKDNKEYDDGDYYE